MVTDKQIKLLGRKHASGLNKEAAAAAAGMTAKTARKWKKKGLLPSQVKQHQQRHWRTRQDPFEGLWDEVIVPELQNDEEEIFEATTLFNFLQDEYPGRFEDGQLRTFQRRVKDWKAFHGPPKEVFFPQEHPPGREAQIDFTHCGELNVTVAGKAFVHLIFQMILTASGFRWAQLAFSETYEALSSGIQGAIWSFGGSTHVWRSDNLSAATHKLKEEAGRELTDRFAGLVEHYGVKSTRITPGKSNENGIVEKSHDVLKRALRQALRLRRSRDFATADEYWAFVQRIIEKLNQPKLEAFAKEQQQLKPLPAAPLPDFTSITRTVSRYSCIRVSKQTYSVPSRLIGYKIVARLHPSMIEVCYRGQVIESFPRLRGDGMYRIDYRHVIHSLVRKPGAFARYKYREELFPTLTFRRAYDSLVGWRGERADVDYVRILHLAATTMECDVAAAIEILMENGTRFDYADVKALVEPAVLPRADLVAPLQPDLNTFDDLLTGECYEELKSQKPREEQWENAVCIG